MYSLIIDSATKVLYISLVNNDKVIEELYVLGENNHSEKIVGLIHDVIKKANIAINDLSKVIVGNGPGSYTGVRLGVVIGKMLATFSNIKLYSIPTLKLMTSNQTKESVAIIDARKNNVYAGGYFNDKLIYNEVFINIDDLINDTNNKYIIIDEDNFKVNPINVIKYATLVENPHSFEPNYIKDAYVDESKK